MELDTVLWLVPVILILAVAIPFLTVVGSMWRHYRQRSEVTCPRNNESALVQLKPCRAALSAAMGSPDLRVETCSFWPKFAGCDQKCVEAVSRF